MDHPRLHRGLRPGAVASARDGPSSRRANYRRSGRRGAGNQAQIRLPRHSTANCRRRRDGSRMWGRVDSHATLDVGRMVDLVGIGDHSGSRRPCDDFLTTEVWRRCVAEAGLALLAGIVLTQPPQARSLVACVLIAAASTAFFWLMWRLSSSLGYGDVKLASGTGFLGATTAASIPHPDFIRAGMTTLLSATILRAVVAIAVTLVRKHRPSPWGSAFAYGPALWAGPWMALVISLE